MLPIDFVDFVQTMHILANPVTYTPIVATNARNYYIILLYIRIKSLSRVHDIIQELLSLCNSIILIQQNRVQIRLTKVHTFIQLLYVLQTNLFTFTESDFVHSFACMYSEVKLRVGKFVTKFTQVIYCELERFTETNCGTIFTNHLLSIFH